LLFFDVVEAFGNGADFTVLIEPKFR
jgi:hypothetical protein